MRPESLVPILIGATFLIIGYLVRFRRQAELIPGYKPERYTDSEGLAKWVGSGMLLLGSFALVVGILDSFYPQFNDSLVPFFVIIAIAMVLLVGMKRYEKKDDRQE